MKTKPLPCAFAAAVLLTAACALPVAAQTFGDALKRTVQRAAQSEVQRKAERETREATRCVLGDARCAGQSAAREPQGAQANAATASGGADPLVPRYEGAKVLRRDADEFTDYALRTGKSRSSGTRTVEGRLTRLTYEGPKDRSVLEVFRNYEAELQRAGFQPLYSCAREQCGDIRKDIESGPRYMLLWGAGDHRYVAAQRKRPEGEAYVAVYVTRNNSGGPAKGRAMIQVDVVESRGMENRMTVVDADAMRRDLARDGRVTLHGIEFDFDRDTIRAESAEQVAQIARLLQQDPKLSVRVVGHTDDQGTHDYNMQLSKRRARRIVDTLAREHSVARSRMEAVGVGASAPIAANDSEEGRARNRRVEIVRR